MRLVIAGNSTIQPEEADLVLKGSYRSADFNQICYSKINDMLDIFENNLHKLSQVIPVDVMPGEFELTTAFLPQ